MKSAEKEKNDGKIYAVMNALTSCYSGMIRSIAPSRIA